MRKLRHKEMKPLAQGHNQQVGQMSGWPSRHREDGMELRVTHVIKIFSKKNLCELFVGGKGVCSLKKAVHGGERKAFQTRESFQQGQVSSLCSTEAKMFHLVRR